MRNFKSSSKRLFSLILAVSLCLTLLGGAPAAAAADYTGHWAQEEIQRAFDTSWLDATDNFRPNDNITRAEFVDMINRAMGFTARGDISAYTDVSESDPYYGAFAIAYAAGYLIGDDKLQFTPNALLTREQAFIIFSRLLKDQPYVDPAVTNGITDWGRVADWASDEVLLSVAAGFVVGMGNGEINPKGHLERGEATVLLGRKYDDARIYLFPGRYTLADAGSVRVSGDDITVTLEATADLESATVTGDARNSAIVFAGGAKADTLTVEAGASGTNVDMAAGSSVGTANLGAGTAVTGAGTITTANITSDGTAIETKPGTVSVGSGLTATIAGQTVTGAAPSGGGGSSSSSGGGSPVPQTISAKALPLSPPVVGEAPMTTFTAAQYTGTVTWSPDPGTTFAGFTEYTATVTLTAASGFTLSGVAENFFTADGMVSAANAAGSGTVTIAYPQTLPAPQNAKISELTAGATTLVWDAVEDAEGYLVYRSNSKFGTFEILGETAPEVLTYTYDQEGSDAKLSRSSYYRIAAKSGPLAGARSDAVSRETDFFGENVYIYAPTDAQNNAHAEAGLLKETANLFREEGAAFDPPNTPGSEQAHFGNFRYAYLFKEGEYNWDDDAPVDGLDANAAKLKIGFYTHVAGLGKLPTDTSIPKMSITSEWLKAGGNVNYGNATQNFWRAIENVELDSNTLWAVSQAAPMRRLAVNGNLQLVTTYPGDNWGSGGFLADSYVAGNINYAGQQQWLTRNTDFGSSTGGQWNVVHVGNTGDVSAMAKNEAKFTNISAAPEIAEKPFLYIDDAGDYQVFVPALRTDASGRSWGAGKANDGMGEGTSIPLDDFYVAKPGVTAATLNAQLAEGKHLMFTPGIYELEDSITVNRANAVVFGLGLATLTNMTAAPCMIIGDVDGVKVSGFMFEAGTTKAPVQLRAGETTAAGNPANPLLLQDLFFRVGGAIAGKVDACVEINRGNTIGDDFWVWRADHGDGVGWLENTATNGTVVNGDNVTFYALMCEHFQEYHTLWNGDDGKLYFYQSEIPYDIMNQLTWNEGLPEGTDGYASYKVADSVDTHEAYGLGIYGVPSNTGGDGSLENDDTSFGDGTVAVYLDNAIEVPVKGGIKILNACTVNLANNGPDGGTYPDEEHSHIRNVINDVGGGAWGIVNSRPFVELYSAPLAHDPAFSLPEKSNHPEGPPLLTITCEGAETIRYTTDGTAPSWFNGTEYTAPFQAGVEGQVVTVRAVAFGADGSVSKIKEVKIGWVAGNIALFKEAKQSSAAGDNRAGDGAVDGIVGDANRWEAASGDDEWLVVDLGGVFDLSAIKLTWQAVVVTPTFELAVARDIDAWENPVEGGVLNDEWTVIREETAYPPGEWEEHTDEYVFNPGEVRARYLLVNCGRCQKYTISLRELEVAGMPAGTNVLPLSPPVAEPLTGQQVVLTAPKATDEVTYSAIDWQGVTAGAYQPGDVPKAVFTATAKDVYTFDATWDGGAGRITIPGATVTYVKHSATQITITAVFATAPEVFDITLPAGATVNGVTLTPGAAQPAYSAGAPVTVTLAATGTSMLGGAFTLGLTSAKSDLIAPPAEILLPAGGTIPAEYLTCSFTMPEEAVDDLTLTFTFAQNVAEANGGLLADTTELTLFLEPGSDITADDVTLAGTGVTVTKNGALTPGDNDGEYKLPVTVVTLDDYTAFTAASVTLTVTVPGVTGRPNTVTVYKVNNLALGATALMTAQNKWWPQPLSNLTDGVLTTRVQSDGEDTGGKNCFVIDLGAEVAFDSVKIAWEETSNNRMKNIRVQYSTTYDFASAVGAALTDYDTEDGWTEFATANDTPNALETTITGEAKTGRYIRIKQIEPYDGWTWPTVGEIGIFNPNP
jgi:hypothetical protein